MGHYPGQTTIFTIGNVFYTWPKSSTNPTEWNDLSKYERGGPELGLVGPVASGVMKGGGHRYGSKKKYVE